MVDYETILDIVAEHPGLDADAVQDTVVELGGEPDVAIDLLARAVQSGNVIEADGKYWIVRKGKYAYSAYDHEP